MGKSFQMDSHVSVIACLPGDEHMFSPKIPITRNLWQLFSFQISSLSEHTECNVVDFLLLYIAYDNGTI